MVLRFTNANGEQFDFRSPDIAVERVDGTGASEVDTFLIERAFREGASYVRRRSRFKVHDERNECKEGDIIRFMETRPLSKEKRWRFVEFVERAK